MNNSKRFSIESVNREITDASRIISNYKNISSRKFQDIFQIVHEKTMLSYPKLWDLHNAIEYINEANVTGSVVEIGVWRGGALAMGILSDDSQARSFIGFDTFEGHLKPSGDEFDIRGNSMLNTWEQHSMKNSRMAYCEYSECYEFLEPLISQKQTLQLFKGDVIETASKSKIQSIAILRLDCDWYRETIFALNFFWERISSGGLIYLDAFGHISGMKKAFTEFFDDKSVKYTHIDYAGVLIVKT